jgi:integrase
MTPLRQALTDYLMMRRALGYQLARAEKLLGQFLAYLEDLGETRVRTDTALAWATQPTGTNPSGWACQRLTVVRGFAAHLQTIDPATEIPPADLLRWRARRATPYLYTDDEVAALIAAAATLRTSHRVATYQTLIGLLVVTGMRVGEAIALDRDDFDVDHGVLVVRRGKFGKSRELPLHASAVSAVDQYLHRDDRPRPAPRTSSALLVSTAGTRLLACNVGHTFRTVVRRAGLTPHSAACRPRLHDVRHRFAVCTFLDAYRHGHDPDARLSLLSTYLGHVDPRNTYWYLSAAPELLQLAGDRLQRHLGGAS